MSVCEYDRPVATQGMAGLAGILLPVEVRHVDGPKGLPAVFGGGIFGVAQPQIKRAASKAAHVRVAMKASSSV